MSENKASTGLVIKLVLTGLVTGLIVPLTAAIWLFFKHKQVDVTLFFNQELMPVFVATPFITAFVGLFLQLVFKNNSKEFLIFCLVKNKLYKV
jgi:hypothetical protein